MERHRPRTARRNRRAQALIAFAAALLVSICVPTLAFGGVSELLGGVLGGQAPRAGVPGTGTGFQPPLHTADPHGQGSVLGVDVGPSNQLPLPNGDPASGDEDIVVGDTRGDYSGGAYHGRVTILHAMVPLIGLSLPDIAFKTEEGQTNTGPLGPLQTQLDAVCTSSSVCLTLLAVNSTTSHSGSQNSFETAGATVGPPGTLSASVLKSSGNISDDGTCQTATGSSSWLDLDGLGGLLTADALQGSSSSKACNNGAPSQTNDSELLNVLGFGIPILPAGCNNGTADTEIIPPAPISSLIVAVCHADDSNGVGEPVSQTTAPYGVRDALDVFLLGGLVRIGVSDPESHAVAPPVVTPLGETGKGKGNPGGADNGNPAGPGDDGSTAAGEAQPGGESLAFTGMNLLLLALIGAGMLTAGLAVTTLSRHQRPAK
jgi:hypothetical protein